MKFSKKLCVLAALIASFVRPGNMFSATAPIEAALKALLGQHYSDEATEVIESSVGQFVANQRYIAENFKKVIQENVGGTVVKSFAIPESDMQRIKEKLQPFTAQPVFYRRYNDNPVPHMEAFKAFEAIGFGMNTAAEKAFFNTDENDSCVSQAGVFDRAQMEVIVDHECCHIKNGDGDLRVLFTFLSQNRVRFSEDEFSRLLGAAFGQDFLNSRKALTDAITRDAQQMGIYDFSKVEGFAMDLMAFQRYYETRVDKGILDSRNRKKIEAYRDLYQNRDDAPIAKDKQIKEKEAIQIFLKRGHAIPLECADFSWPTDLERVEACNQALARLYALEVFMIRHFSSQAQDHVA